MILTLNEEANVGGCLASLAAQRNRDFEVVVIDAASHDRTVEVLRELQPDFPVRLRLHVARRRLSIGEARNWGVELAGSSQVAFLSADAEVDGGWVDEALRSLEDADLAFSRQVHAPRRWTVGASVRGSRYRFPASHVDDPLPLASNVAAAYRREVLAAFPFEPWSNAAEDLLLARRAAAAGYRALYNPRMIVRHGDVPDARAELRKNLREGRGWGLYRRELGLFAPMLGWGLVLGLSPLAALLVPLPLALVAVALVLWSPALRRAVRRRREMPAGALALGALAGPLFDVAFLLAYLHALAAGAGRIDRHLAKAPRVTPLHHPHHDRRRAASPRQPKDG